MDVEIEEAISENAKEISNLFSTVITHTFKKEKIFNPIELQKEIVSQILNFKNSQNSKKYFFLIAKHNSEIIATISYGPLNDIIKNNSNIKEDVLEIKSVYVLPKYHGKGIGSKIYISALKRIKMTNAKQYCLDSGYQKAQMFWTKKLGKEHVILKNYWGKNLDHKIWLIDLI